MKENFSMNNANFERIQTEKHPYMDDHIIDDHLQATDINEINIQIKGSTSSQSTLQATQQITTPRRHHEYDNEDHENNRGQGGKHGNNIGGCENNNNHSYEDDDEYNYQHDNYRRRVKDDKHTKNIYDNDDMGYNNK